MKKWPLLLASSALCSLLALRGGAQIVSRGGAPASPDPPASAGDPPLRRSRPPFSPPFVPPVPFPARLTELRLETQSARVEIRGPVAVTHLRQVLRNPTQRPLEGTYLFALPDGAAVSNFAMTMGGKRLAAEILDGDKAREIYTGIVQKMRDPAILEFVGRGLARVKIFPVPPGGTAEIELDYSQNVSDGRLSLPLRGPQSGRGAAPDARASVQVSLEGADLRAVYSPSHRVETRRVGGKTLISGEFADSNRDFSLLWTRGGERVGLNLFTSRNEGEDGTFLLLAAPDAALSRSQIEAKDVVFVFDTSGSMEGAKIEQARRALKTLLGNLGPQDRFGIVTFASGAQSFRETLIAASPANLSAARAFADRIQALGGTNISEALQSAFAMTQKSARPQQIVFLTDGQPTVGQTDIDALLADAQRQNTAQARLFSFGLGNDVNARLLDGLASDNRGASDYVAPDEDIEVKVGALYEKIAFPVLSDGQIDFGGLQVYDVYPPRLPDLFKGAQVTVFGRFRGPLSRQIALSGQSNGQKTRFSGQVSPYDSADLPKLWATRKVGYLIEDARRQNRALDGEVRDEIIKLSRQYAIVTPLTAALITEDEAPGVNPPSPSFALGNRGIFRNRAASPSRGQAGGGGFGGLSNGAVGAGGNFQANSTDSGVQALPGLAQSGAAGVATAQKARELREGRADTAQGVKVVAGKTFVLREGVWTDSVFDLSKAGPVRVVKFASNEYFELLRDRKIAPWLSVGERVVLVWQGKALRIEP